MDGHRTRYGRPLVLRVLIPCLISKRKDKFKTLCTIRADVSNVPVFPLKRSPVHLTRAESARPFYRRKFWVILSFGMTEMKAEIKWFEGVRTDRSSGSITLAYQYLNW